MATQKRRKRTFPKEEIRVTPAQRMAIDKVIKSLGGLTAACRTFEISPAAIGHWRRRGMPTELDTRKRIIELGGVSVKDRKLIWPELYA